MVKNLKIFKRISALALAGGITLSSASMVHAEEPKNYSVPSYEQVKKNGTSNCYIDVNGEAHKGKPSNDVSTIIKFENFGSNMILNGQKVLYGTEKVSDKMYHLYMELNKDFGTDVMLKTYTEEDGIYNLLDKLLDDGVSVEDAVGFIGIIDSNIYTGYGKDEFWYENVKDKNGDYVANKYMKNIPPKKEKKEESNIQYVYIPVPQPETKKETNIQYVYVPVPQYVPNK